LRAEQACFARFLPGGALDDAFGFVAVEVWSDGFAEKTPYCVAKRVMFGRE
jgi:hypothetical protein